MTLVTVFVISLLALLIFLMSADVLARKKELKVEACQAVVNLERTRLEAITDQLTDNVVKLAVLGSLYHRVYEQSPDLIRFALVEYFQKHQLAVGIGVWYEPWQLDPEHFP